MQVKCKTEKDWGKDGLSKGSIIVMERKQKDGNAFIDGNFPECYNEAISQAWICLQGECGGIPDFKMNGG